MNDEHPQSTLREWRSVFFTPRRLGLLAAISAVVTLASPFGTAERLSFGERALYWSAITFAGAGLGFYANILADRLRLALIPHLAVSGLICGGFLLALVLAINLVAFAYWPSPGEFFVFGGTVVAISVIVNTAAVLSFRTAPDAQVTAELVSPAVSVPKAPPLLDRLPLDKRGELVSLTVEDHYVRVRTAKGEELLLMRLSDAIRETGDVPGAQVHRSHWAAFAAVRGATRQGDRAILTMAHGPDIPVSRANLEKIREAGLLPK